MKAVDANVIVRWVTRDDPRQAALAEEALATPVFVTLTVLIEVAWVLRRSYRFDRTMLNAALTILADRETVTIAFEDGVRWALGRQAQGADLPDMLHLIAAYGTSAFVTFERGLARDAGPDTPLPVETLA